MDTASEGVAATAEPAVLSLGQATAFWLKLGLISFGGPAGQIAIMHQELVERRRWISERRFLHALNYCMVLPGPEAQQLATYIGWLLHGVRGGLLAGGLFVLPSLFVLMALSWVYLAHGGVPMVAAFFYGIKPAVTAVVVFAAWRIGKRALRHPILWAFALAAFLAIFALGLPFPYILLAAALAGALGGRLAPGWFQSGGAQGPSGRYGPALVDDCTPTPDHARFTWRRLGLLALSGVLIWSGAMSALAATFGPESIFTRMGEFFTQAALLTFGGAYAVLPYVYQAAVEQYQWLTPVQMIDGLALGETTPGPLIMVVAFVGFVGGWQSGALGPEALLLAGVIAATVASFFTFLPSFLFILVGGPLVEASHGNLKLTAPLTGITAAVVGVIANLAVFFAYHVLWPQGLEPGEAWRGLDAFSAGLGAAAVLALFRGWLGIVPLIGACGAAGVAYRLLG